MGWGRARRRRCVGFGPPRRKTHGVGRRRRKDEGGRRQHDRTGAGAASGTTVVAGGMGMGWPRRAVIHMHAEQGRCAESRLQIGRDLLDRRRRRRRAGDWREKLREYRDERNYGERPRSQGISACAARLPLVSPNESQSRVSGFANCGANRKLTPPLCQFAGPSGLG